MSEPITIWRCRGCGKWSHAKRRPAPHLRREPWMDGWVRIGTLKVVCGPFVRWTATPDARDADRPDPRGLGNVERRYEWVDDPNEGLAEEYSRSIIDGINARDAAVHF